MLPIQQIRKWMLKDGNENPTSYEILDSNESKVTELKGGHQVVLSNDGTRLKLAQESGYKTYTVLSILFLLKSQTLDHSAYLQQSLAQDIPTINFMDKKDLLDYVSGVNETSRHVAGSERKDLPADANAKDTDKTKSIKQMQGATEKLESIKKDRESSKRIVAKERTIHNTKNILTVKGTRNLSLLQKLGQDFFLQKRKSGSSKPTSSKHHQSSSSSNNHHPSRKSRHSTTPTLKAGKKPIIIVPAAMTSSLTLYNVSEFLQDSKYSSTQDMMNKKSGPKPLNVIITRKQSRNNVPKAFEVVDAVDKFTHSDWERVVAVFAAGQEWQFTGWKWRSPVDIFHNVIGFNLNFNDEPVNANIKNWNVKAMTIHRNRRHLDGQIVYDFWNAIDEWISNKKPYMCQ